MQKMWVQSLGQEDPLTKEIATHSSILPGKSHEQRNLVAVDHGVAEESGTTYWLNNKDLSLTQVIGYVIYYVSYVATTSFTTFKSQFPYT